MDVNITITHTLSAEVLALFQGFAAVGTTTQPAPAKGDKRTAPAMTAVKSEMPATNEPTGTTTSEPTGTKEENNNQAQSTVTLASLRLAVQEKSQAGKKEEIKGLLKQFGAANLTSLEAVHYADFSEKLKAI